MGYGFYWPPYGKPRLVDPNGRNIPLEVHHYCPYILDHSRVPGNPASRYVAPATKSSGSSADPNRLDGYDPNGAQTEDAAAQSCRHRRRQQGGEEVVWQTQHRTAAAEDPIFTNALALQGVAARS